MGTAELRRDEALAAEGEQVAGDRVVEGEQRGEDAGDEQQ